MKRFVIDASAAIDIARGVVTIEETPVRFFAPELIDLEFANALRKLVIHRKVAAEQAEAYFTAWASNQVTRISHARLLRRAWELRGTLSSYDASYVALAERLELPLLTTDDRLGRTAAKYCEVWPWGATGS